MKYIHKPNIVDAIQYLGTDESYYDVLDFAAGYIIGGYRWRDAPKKLMLYTQHGPRAVAIGDFIIKRAHDDFMRESETSFTRRYEEFTE